MSSAKVKTVSKRIINYTSTWATGTLTVTTSSAHYLATGNIVSLQFADTPQELNRVAVTVTGANTFTIALTDGNQVQSVGKVIIGYWGTGVTGDQDVFSLPKATGTASVLQFTASGTGGASLTVYVTVDGIGWVALPTVSLAAADLATDFITIAPGWAQAKVNVTSVGAATAVRASLSS